MCFAGKATLSVFASFAVFASLFGGEGSALSAPVRAGTSGETGARAALERPLILGASVSSGFVTDGPGNRAVRRFRGGGQVHNVAAPMATAASGPVITAQNCAAYTSVIAVDYLFWDSVEPDPSASIAALHRLVSACAAAGVPVVLGDIPALKPEQVSRTALNDAIHSACQRRFGCRVLPLDRLHRQLVTRGVVIGGRLRHADDVFADGIHLNGLGSEYVASLIVQLLR